MLLKETFRKVLIVTIVIVQTKTFIPTCRGTEISHYQKPIIELNMSSEHVSVSEQCHLPFTWGLGDFSNNIVCLRFICVNFCENIFMFMYTKHRRSVNYNICIIFAIFCNCMCLMRDSKGCRSPDPPTGKFKLINLPKWTSELPGKQKYVTDHPTPGKPSSGSAHMCFKKSCS